MMVMSISLMGWGGGWGGGGWVLGAGCWGTHSAGHKLNPVFKGLNKSENSG